MKKVQYDITNAAVASCSATGFLAKYFGYKDFDKCLKEGVELTILNMTTVSNLQMLKAFIEDLIYLEEVHKVRIILSNTYEE